MINNTENKQLIREHLLNDKKYGYIWLKAIESLYESKGISLLEISSKNSASVKELQIDQNEISAQVKSADAQFFKIKMRFDTLSENYKEQLKSYINSNPSMALEVSLGYFSKSFKYFFETEFSEINPLQVFPQALEEINVKCSCGKNGLCNHVIAAFFALEKEIDKNSFILLNLKGISTTELIESAGTINVTSQKIDKTIHSKFIPSELVDKILPPSEIEEITKEQLKDFSFPKVDIYSLFSLLPANPMFFERKDFKSKLINIYETVESEIDSILVQKNLAPLRDTEFYLYYSPDNVLNAFIAPSNNFIYYLKAQGSRARYTNLKLSVPVVEGEQIVWVEKEGISIQADVVLEYFLYYSLQQREEVLKPSSKFLKITASFAVSLVKSLSFAPQVSMQNKDDFAIRYVPLTDNDIIDDTIDSHSAVMPVNLIFSMEEQKVLSREASNDVLSMFVTHIIHKLTFLKASKLKIGSITNIFAKPNAFSAISPEGKNIAASISYWLDILSMKNKTIKPVIRIESLNNKEFNVNVDIIDHKTNEVISLAQLFEEKEEVFSISAKRVRTDISEQILVASNYLPLLKEILDSKGLAATIIDLKEILELISKTSGILNALGIRVVIPKELKNILSPRLLLKANVRNNAEIDVASLFDMDNNSHISLKDLLNFSYEIAIGDEKISREEFLRLVKSADGIVKYKDQYILLKPEEINSIISKLDKPMPEYLSPLDLIHTTLSGFYNDVDFNPDDALKRAVEEFIKIDEVTIPEGLNGQLRPYQERGFRWLYSNTKRRFGSCMADDMGLGKTIQAISLILKTKEEGNLKNPVLVVCPTTLVGNWHKECARFAPSLNVSIYHGVERSLEVEEADVFVTTYGLLRNDIEKFREKSWDFVIIDEAQNIKNPDAAQTVAVKSIQGKTYIAMTGTPVENRLSELWSIFDFTNKGYLGNIARFQRNYAKPIEKYRDNYKIEKLKLVTAPFVLRRLKNDKSIITDLPEKLVFDEYCYLSKEQAALYEKVLETSFKTIESSSGIQRKGHIFKLITALKQICNHPSQYTKTGVITKELSGKAEKLVSIMANILENKEKAVIFTQYKEMGDLLVAMLKNEFKIEVPFFHGAVTRLKRDELVEDFQTKDDIKLMIVSLKAGGTGLNLTAATNVIHYDLWWNPAVEDQATDRTYRIGQNHNVIVHRLVTLGTFEEKIDEMIKAKKELADLTVSTGEKLITELSDKELKEIFRIDF